MKSNDSVRTWRTQLTSGTAALMLAGCGAHSSEKAAVDAVPRIEEGRVEFAADSPQLRLIEVQAARAATSTALQINGRLTWDEDVTVRVFSPFAGRVQQVLVQQGSHVEPGEPLAAIASPDYGQAQADLRRAATDLQLAERNATRLRELAEHDAAAAKDVLAAEADLGRAQAEESRARARLALFGAEAGAIDNAFSLKSPIAGVVVEKGLSPGQEVRPDQMLAGVERLAAPLFTITDPTRLWLLLDITEAEAAQIAVGQRLELRTATHPDHRFEATLDFEADALDPVTRTVRARARVDNHDHLLKAEQLVRVEVAATGSPATAVEVPARAVFLRGEGQFVFAETAPGRFERRAVRVGATRHETTQIIGGLQAGDRVVSNGATLLEQLSDVGGS